MRICLIILINIASSVPMTESRRSISPSILSIISEAGKDGSIGGGAINEKPRLYKNRTVNKITYLRGGPETLTSTNDRRDERVGDTTDASVKTSWDPISNLSHMLHALVGLDRYPNYLSRFRNTADIDLLENALEESLQKVRKQKAEIVKRGEGVRKLVKTFINSHDFHGDDVGMMDTHQNVEGDNYKLWLGHPILSRPKTWKELRERNVLTEKAFQTAFRSVNKKSTKSGKNGTTELFDIISGQIDVKLDPSLLEDLMEQEMFDVYSFPLFSNKFCAIIRKTLRELYSLGGTAEFNHLELGRRPIDLDSIGLGWITDLIFQMFLQPISRHLFANTEKLSNSEDESGPLLDWRQGYVAGYSVNPTSTKGVTRHRLVPHADDSEITVNCCIGEKNFQGGNVEFYGLRGTPEEGQLNGVVTRPDVGRALIHSGRHLHAVSDVTSGDRYALVVWSRSWGRFRAETCPCCFLNRRLNTSTCICGKRWN
mmetsp:Transcript_16147/g.33737  ORF Transcript_16147/g.33737 Transcript_16147/m.33737 type:complete len:484 (-) Transcript_16147:223-1674(-)